MGGLPPSFHQICQASPRHLKYGPEQQGEVGNNPGGGIHVELLVLPSPNTPQCPIRAAPQEWGTGEAPQHPLCDRDQAPGETQRCAGGCPCRFCEAPRLVVLCSAGRAGMAKPPALPLLPSQAPSAPGCHRTCPPQSHSSPGSPCVPRGQEPAQLLEGKHRAEPWAGQGCPAVSRGQQVKQGMCVPRERHERETEAEAALLTWPRSCQGLNSPFCPHGVPLAQYPRPWGSSGTGRETAQLPGHCQPHHSRLAWLGHWHSLCDHICSWGKATATAGGGTSLQHPAHPRAQPGAPRGRHRVGPAKEAVREKPELRHPQRGPGLSTVNPSAKKAAKMARAEGEHPLMDHRPSRVVFSQFMGQQPPPVPAV